jgi:hypothetical protein
MTTLDPVMTVLTLSLFKKGEFVIEDILQLSFHRLCGPAKEDSFTSLSNCCRRLFNLHTYFVLTNTYYHPTCTLVGFDLTAYSYNLLKRRRYL